MHWWSAATSHSRDTLACWPLQTHTPVKQHHRTLMCAGVELVAHALLAVIDVVRGWSSNNPGSRSQWTSVSYNIALPALLGAEAAHIAGTLHTPLLSSWLHIAVLHLPSRLLNPTATTARQRMSGRACRTGACTQKSWTQLLVLYSWSGLLRPLSDRQTWEGCTTTWLANVT